MGALNLPGRSVWQIKFILNKTSLVSDDLVSEDIEEDIEEDITDELPCTLAIEDSTQDSTQANQVSFSHFS